jgi:glycosyltransferase involved in cell wall biosynthesis
VSEVAAQKIRDVVGPDIPVLVTPNGVDPQLWRVTPIPHGVDEVHAVAVMRLAPRKRAMALLGILRSARSEVPADIRLRATIVGDGPDRGRVERYIDQHELDITLAGRLPHEGIRDLYATADLFVQPSIKESFGLAALEARTAGIPIIARQETGITEFVHQGVEGLLADSDEHMAGAIAFLATHPDQRARMAEHNRTVEPQQVWPRVLESVERAYEAARLRVTS